MKVLLLIATLIACAQAYSFTIPANIKHPGVCMYNGKTLQIGENRLSSRCQIMHCYEDGSIYVEGCGKLEKSENRIIDQLNIDRAYPECCKDVSLEQGQVQEIGSSLDSRTLNQKTYYPQGYHYRVNYPLDSQVELNRDLYSQRYYPQGIQQGEYSQRYYPQGRQHGYYNQDQYKNDEMRNQDDIYEYRQGNPLSSLIRLPYLLDYMYRRGVLV